MSHSDLTTADLVRLSNLAYRYRQMNITVAKKFQERYGITYSDIDAADDLVEVLEYGFGSVTLKQADQIMLNAGYPVLKKVQS